MHRENSLNITTENGRVSIKDTYTGRQSSKENSRSNIRNSANFAKTNPKERSVSKEIKRELCSSGNPMRSKIKVKDDGASSKNSLEVTVNQLPVLGKHYPLMQKGATPMTKQTSYGAGEGGLGSASP